MKLGKMMKKKITSIRGVIILAQIQAHSSMPVPKSRPAGPRPGVEQVKLNLKKAQVQINNGGDINPALLVAAPIVWQQVTSAAGILPQLLTGLQQGLNEEPADAGSAGLEEVPGALQQKAYKPREITDENFNKTMRKYISGRYVYEPEDEWLPDETIKTEKEKQTNQSEQKFEESKKQAGDLKEVIKKYFDVEVYNGDHNVIGIREPGATGSPDRQWLAKPKAKRNTQTQKDTVGQTQTDSQTQTRTTSQTETAEVTLHDAATVKKIWDQLNKQYKSKMDHIYKEQQQIVYERESWVRSPASKIGKGKGYNQFQKWQKVQMQKMFDRRIWQLEKQANQAKYVYTHDLPLKLGLIEEKHDGMQQAFLKFICNQENEYVLTSTQ